MKLNILALFAILLWQSEAAKDKRDKPIKPKETPKDLLTAETQNRGGGHGNRQSYSNSYQSPPQSYHQEYNSGPHYYEVTSKPVSYSTEYHSPPQNYHREYNSGPQSSYHESPAQNTRHRDSYSNEDSDGDSYSHQDSYGDDDHGNSYDDSH